jgi:hypothetical protein
VAHFHVHQKNRRGPCSTTVFSLTKGPVSKARKEALLGVVTVAMTLLLFIPYMIFRLNALDLVEIGVMSILLLALSLVGAGAVALGVWLLPEKWMRPISLAAAILAASIWIQAYLLKWDYGVLEVLLQGPLRPTPLPAGRQLHRTLGSFHQRGGRWGLRPQKLRLHLGPAVRLLQKQEHLRHGAGLLPV